MHKESEGRFLSETMLGRWALEKASQWVRLVAAGRVGGEQVLVVVDEGLLRGTVAPLEPAFMRGGLG